MIRGIHGLFYSSEPDATRDFFKDKLKLPFTDVGHGWLIFDFKEGDLGVHPTEEAGHSGTHDISFFCDDIDGTVAELRARGVEMDSEIQDRGFGRTINLKAPGNITVLLYEPRYQKRSQQKAAPRKPAARTAAKKKAPAKKAKAGNKRR